MESGRFDLAAQQRWLLAGGDAAESSCTLMVDDARIDLDSLRNALLAAVSKHEILRTRFDIPAGMLSAVQVVESEPKLGWGIEPASDAALRCEATQHDGSITFSLRASAAIADSSTLLAIGMDAIRVAAGEANDSDDEPLQYADFAGWQQEKQAETGAANLAAVSYWRSQRFDAVRVDGNRAEHAVLLDTAAANALSVTLGVDQRAVWLALSAIVAARISGESAISVALHIDGRQDPELVGAVGAYLTALPAVLHDVLSSDVGALCFAAAAAQRQATAHALLAPDLAPSARLGFSFTDPRCSDDAIAVVEVRDGVVPSACEVAYEVRSDSEIRCTVASHGDDAERDAANFGAHLAALVRALTLVASNDQPLVPAATVSIWGEQSAAAALLRGIAPAIVDERPSSMLEAVRLHAQRTPDALAVVGGDRSFTYGELWTKAVSIADAILDAGGVAGGVAASPVAIFLDRTAETVPAMLAAWIAGSPYLPLHIDHPIDRLALQVAAVGCTLVVSTSELAKKLPGGLSIVDIGNVEPKSVSDDPATPELATGANGESLAYVIFTSGSTGTPKGVGVTHANIVGYAAAARHRLLPGNDPIDSAMVTSCTTDLGNTSLLLSLLTGGCVSVVPLDVAVDGHRYSEWNAAHPVDLLKITPSHLRALLTAGAGVLPSKLLVIGGEALSWDLVRDVEALSDCAISNHYGPTETTIGALTMFVERDAKHPKSATVPIGRPLPGYRAFVLDAVGAPVPDGVAGELCIGGEGVASGYVGRDDFTAERFVADPFGERMYRTGDSVRRHTDDAIEFLGRIDGQVKIRGYRVEPGEIESVLERYVDVSQAAVVADHEPNGDLRLVAYLTGDLAGPTALDSLRAHVTNSLPSHMIPALFLTLDSMPLTPNGKLDRAALPDPATVRLAMEDNFVAPRDEVEQLLSNVWSELLGVERVGATDDFFALGGHSLLAAQVVARILRDFGVHLGLHSLFIAPTIEALAILVTDAQIEASGGEEAFAAMLDELEGLTDDEVEALLNDDLNSCD